MEWKEWTKNPRYEVSRCGKVRSKDMTITENGTGKIYVKKGKMLSTYLNNKGYVCVQAGKVEAVHRIVAHTFLINPDPNVYAQVDHIDSNKLNNHVDNLEWVTIQENLRRAYDNGLRNISGLVNHRELIKRPVAKIKDGEIIKTFNSLSEASVDCYGNANGASNIRRACISGGKSKGFHWKYV